MSAAFTYTPLPEGHIRLLHVKRLHNNGAAYELHDKPLDDGLRFRAISYVWGNFDLTHCIECNGNDLRVTRSVSEVLSSTVIASFGDELPIWIDFICINQRDNAEKSEQVRRMDSLYSLAEEVVVWLGPASADSDLAMDTIRALSEKKALISQENYAGFANSRDTLQNAGLASAGEEIRSAIGSLLCRGWFQRLWVFQEAVLCSEDPSCLGHSSHGLGRLRGRRARNGIAPATPIYDHLSRYRFWLA